LRSLPGVVMSASACPASLKKISQFITKAEEIDSRNKVVSYHLRLFALQEAMAMRAQVPKADMGFIMELMDKLEVDKKDLGEMESPGILVENFGVDLFMKADDRDRSGQSDAGTAKMFHAAAKVLEACKQFGELPDDLKEKVKYANVRFIEILKAKKEGVAPPPPRGMVDDPPAADADGAAPSAPSVDPPPAAPDFTGYPPAAPPADLPDYMGLPPAAPPGYPPAAPTYPPAAPGYPPAAPGYPPQPPSGYPAAPPTDYGGLPAAPPTHAMPGAPPMAPPAGRVPSGMPPGMMGAQPGFKPERAAILEAMTLCKSALSGLQFQDTDTAVHQLGQALILLTQPPMPSTTDKESAA